MTAVAKGPWAEYEHEPHYVYALVASDHPRTIRYIGVTRDHEARFRQHTKRVRHGTQVQRWAQEVRERGQSVQMLVLGTFATRSEAVGREWRWTRWFRRRGMCDLNLARDASQAFDAMVSRPGFVSILDRNRRPA